MVDNKIVLVTLAFIIFAHLRQTVCVGDVGDIRIHRRFNFEKFQDIEYI